MKQGDMQYGELQVRATIGKAGECRAESANDLCCPNTKGVFSGECLEASDKVLSYLLSGVVFVSAHGYQQ